MKLMNLPKTHPMSFRRFGGSRYGGMIDRNFMLGHDPLDTHINRPLANLLDCDNFYLLEIPLPGYKKEELTLDVVDARLVIKGSHTSEESPETEYLLKEYDKESFERSFELNDVVDTDGISAKFEDGVLKVKLPYKKDSVNTSKRKVELK